LAPTLSQPAECHGHARHGHRCSRAEPLAPPPPPLQRSDGRGQKWLLFATGHRECGGRELHLGARSRQRGRVCRRGSHAEGGGGRVQSHSREAQACLCR
jgi:hypothetical protein